MFGGSKIKKKPRTVNYYPVASLKVLCLPFFLGGKPSQILPARPIKLVFSPNLGEVFGWIQCFFPVKKSEVHWKSMGCFLFFPCCFSFDPRIFSIPVRTPAAGTAVVLRDGWCHKSRSPSTCQEDLWLGIASPGSLKFPLVGGWKGKIVVYKLL